MPNTVRTHGMASSLNTFYAALLILLNPCEFPHFT